MRVLPPRKRNMIVPPGKHNIPWLYHKCIYRMRTQPNPPSWLSNGVVPGYTTGPTTRCHGHWGAMNQNHKEEMGHTNQRTRAKRSVVGGLR